MSKEGPWWRESKRCWYVWISGHQRSLGVRDKKDRKAARQAWHRLLAEAGERRGKQSEATVARVISAFLDDVEGRVTEKTRWNYSYFLGAFAKVRGSVKAEELAPTEAERFARQQPSWSDTTKGFFLGALVTAYGWSVRARIIRANPLLGLVKPPKASRGAWAVLSAEEREKLLAEASPAFRMFLAVVFATGARPGEAAALTAENFDADAGLAKLERHKMAYKGQARTIYIPPTISELLKRQRELYPSGPLLRNRAGRPWNGKAWVRAMGLLRARVGLPRCIAYSGRHTFATDALSEGVNPAQVAELLGHSGLGSLKHYSHLETKQATLQAALDRVRQ
jgi:integrase